MVILGNLSNGLSTGFSPNCNVYVTFIAITMMMMILILILILIIIIWLLRSQRRMKMRVNTSIPESEMLSQKGE